MPSHASNVADAPSGAVTEAEVPMVERVARALHRAHSECGRRLYTEAMWDLIDRFEREMWFFSARAAIEAMPGWKPIETAPRDGTRVDVWVDGRRVPDVYWSFSRNAQGVVIPSAFDCWAKWGKSSGMGGAYPASISGEPTHWMPLPEPPSAALS